MEATRAAVARAADPVTYPPTSTLRGLVAEAARNFGASGCLESQRG
jgi:hypothetical protein